MNLELKYNGPWTFDYGQLRDKQGNSLASFPTYPGGFGEPHDLRNGQLCALVPELVYWLETLVKRIQETPFDGNDGMNGTMIVEAKELLERIKRF
jgi:hypothetical protein